MFVSLVLLIIYYWLYQMYNVNGPDKAHKLVAVMSVKFRYGNLGHP